MDELSDAKIRNAKAGGQRHDRTAGRIERLIGRISCVLEEVPALLVGVKSADVADGLP